MPFISVFKVGGGTGSSDLILVTGSSSLYIRKLHVKLYIVVRTFFKWFIV